MSRLVDIDEVLDLFGNQMEDWDAIHTIEEAICNGSIPITDGGDHVVHGKWKKVDAKGMLTPGGTPIVTCSVCKSPYSEHLSGVEFPEKWDYCPVCGSKMDIDRGYFSRRII